MSCRDQNLLSLELRCFLRWLKCVISTFFFFQSSVKQTELSNSELRQYINILLDRTLKIIKDLCSHIRDLPWQQTWCPSVSQFPIFNWEKYLSASQDCLKTATLWSTGMASLSLPVNDCIRNTLAGGPLGRGQISLLGTAAVGVMEGLAFSISWIAEFLTFLNRTEVDSNISLHHITE